MHIACSGFCQQMKQSDLTHLLLTMHLEYVIIMPADTTQYAGDAQVRSTPFDYVLSIRLLLVLFHDLTSLVHRQCSVISGFKQ